MASHITILKNSDKNSAELYELVNQHVEQAVNWFDIASGILSYSWNAHKNRLRFALNHTWWEVKGEIVINGSDLILIVHVPLLLQQHKKTIRANVDELANKIITGNWDIKTVDRNIFSKAEGELQHN